MNVKMLKEKVSELGSEGGQWLDARYLYAPCLRCAVATNCDGATPYIEEAANAVAWAMLSSMPTPARADVFKPAPDENIREWQEWAVGVAAAGFAAAHGLDESDEGDAELIAGFIEQQQ